MKKHIRINWENEAKLSLKDACAFIRKDSPKNAEKVKREILEEAALLSQHPEKHALDKYKIENDGTYRAFELHHYRIVYRVIHLEVKILTVRHTSMEPKTY